MNIALLLHALSRNNGISRVVLSLAEEFSKLGHETHIYASRLLLTNPDRQTLPGKVFLHRYPCLRGSGRIWTAPFGALLPYLKGSHDIVVSNLLTVWQDIIVMHNDPQPTEVKKMSAVPFTLDIPCLNSTNRKRRTFVESQRFVKGRYKQVVALSQRSAAEIKEAYGVPGERLSVIRHGIDSVYFSNSFREAHRKISRDLLGITEKELVYIYVGDSWKGLEFAIKGIAKSKISGNAVLVAAGPFHPDKFSDLARESGLRFIAKNDWPDIRELYSAGDVFINPTPMDTFGLAVLEALSMGLAVITTRYAGMSEHLTHEKNALILNEPWDVQGISSFCDHLSDDSFRESLCSSGIELAKTLSWSAPAFEHLNLYQKLFQRK